MDGQMDWDTLMNCQEAQSQEEGQDDQGTVKPLRGYPELLKQLGGSPLVQIKS